MPPLPLALVSVVCLMGILLSVVSLACSFSSSCVDLLVACVSFLDSGEFSFLLDSRLDKYWQ